MPSSYTMTRRVAFSETDAAGIVHFSNFFRYMEDAEHAFLRSLGLSVHRQHGDRVEGFPRVSASCDYRRPLRFEEAFSVYLTVAEKNEKSIEYRIQFIRNGEDEPVAEGRVTVVYAVKEDPGSRFRAAALPPDIDAAVEAHQS